MKRIERFMREFFNARTAEIKRELESRESFRRIFFSDDCTWDSRRDEVSRSESEEIVTVSMHDANNSRAAVVTQPMSPFPKLRYHLESKGENWAIRSVDIECLRCRGESGISKCSFCKGAGWLHERDQSEQINLLDTDLERRKWHSRGRQF